MADEAIYQRANLFLQIGLVLAFLVIFAGVMNWLNFDYAFYAAAICVAAGAGIRQIIVARNS